MNEKLIREFKDLKENKTGQTSVELILLIGSILVISIISGTYIFEINSKINHQFNETMNKARIFLLNKV
ncbi:MAG: class III signal peptide-containing protein [Methanobrevibacter sp.]|nr:class III signal peptide-containing protein [Methanobrevibacter sp.]